NGLDGANGATGATGATGSQGQPGANGVSGYQRVVLANIVVQANGIPTSNATNLLPDGTTATLANSCGGACSLYVYCPTGRVRRIGQKHDDAPSQAGKREPHAQPPWGERGPRDQIAEHDQEQSEEHERKTGEARVGLHHANALDDAADRGERQGRDGDPPI